MEIEKIISIAKRRGFIFPSSEIYGGFSGHYDYGPVGILMKRKIENFWREFFVKSEKNIWEAETSLIQPEKVFEASGHLKDFIDPITQCKKCNTIYRADELVEELTHKPTQGMSVEELNKILKNHKCPKCKGQLGEIKVFNLMFKTTAGPIQGSSAYFRPETAQGIFINFRNLLNATRAKLPFGIAQSGKSFRNEISPRQWIMRLREFNQMEIEMFVHPKKLDIVENFNHYSKVKITILTREEQQKNGKPTEILVEEALKKGIIPNKFLAFFMAKEQVWYEKLGIPREAIRFRHMLPKETPHYSKGNFDMEIKFDFGWKEVVGNSYRTDFDLTSHSKSSGQDLSYIEEDGQKIIPHVIEPSFGIDRTIYAILLYSFRQGKERGWEWFELPPKISPYVAAVYPLLSKDNLPEKATEIFQHLRDDFDIFFDESGSIGKRYARADEIGVPFCLTIDHQTLKDSTLTIRDRNTTKQVRVKVSDLKEKLIEILHDKKISKG